MACFSQSSSQKSRGTSGRGLSGSYPIDDSLLYMPSAAKEKYKCAYCSRSFPRPASLGSHVYRSHPEHRQKAAAKAVSSARKVPATTSRIEELAKPKPAPVLEHEFQPSAPAVVSPATPPNPALTHLDAAISGLEKEVETDQQELTRLEALQQGLGKKQELLAGLIKERGKFVGQE